MNDPDPARTGEARIEEIEATIDARTFFALRRRPATRTASASTSTPAPAAVQAATPTPPGGTRSARGTDADERSDVVTDAPRVLCLHGWLDNAASFVPLMAHLPHVDLVALDLPGHGHSAWLPGGYTLFEMACFTRRFMTALEWPDCHLVGHSMGGCVAPSLAVAAPDAVTSMVLIEASGPLSEEADALPARLVRALSDRLDVSRFTSRTFPDRDAAIAARLKAARMERASAGLIIDRQIAPADGGFHWRFDPALRTASAQYQTEAQVRAILGAVACPTLTVIAADGFLATREDTEGRLSRLATRHTVTLPGHHHLHMDDPEPVASALHDFLV